MKSIILTAFYVVISLGGCEDPHYDGNYSLEKIWGDNPGRSFFSGDQPGISDENVVFLSNSGDFHGYSKKDGTKKWVTKTDGRGPLSTRIVANKDEFFYDFFESTMCLDASTGAFKWIFRKSLPSNSSPEITENYVFTGDLDPSGSIPSDGNIYCLDRQTGNQIWKTSIGIYAREMIASPEDNLLYVGSQGGRIDSSLGYINYGYLYCLNMTTGSIQWKFKTDYDPKNNFYGSDIFSKPEIWKEWIYITSGKELICLDRFSGSMKWHTAVTKGFWIGVTVDSLTKRGYSVDYIRPFCFDLESGKILWQNFDPLGISTFDPVTVYNGIVYAGALAAYNATTGEKLYYVKTNLDDALFLTAKVADGMIFTTGYYGATAYKTLK